MKHILRIALFILYEFIIYEVLTIPYGTTGKTEEAMIESLSPRKVNNGFDPLFGFCLYAPLLLFIESFFFKIPFKRWQTVLLILQFTGVVLTLPFAFFVPLGIPLGRVEPDLFALVIILWALYVLLWNLFLLIPATRKWKWVSWPFIEEA